MDELGNNGTEHWHAREYISERHALDVRHPQASLVALASSYRRRRRRSVSPPWLQLSRSPDKCVRMRSFEHFFFVW